MNTFEEFQQAVFDRMDEIDPSRGFDMSLRIASSGVFDPFVDEPFRWTKEEAQVVARHVMDQGKRDDDFLDRVWPRVL